MKLELEISVTGHDECGIQWEKHDATTFKKGDVFAHRWLENRCVIVGQEQITTYMQFVMTHETADAKDNF